MKGVVLLQGKTKPLNWVAIFITLLLLTFCSGCGGGDGNKITDKSSNAVSASDSGHYTMADLANLKHTENFAQGAIEHIFDGTINKKGKATGYHYSMIEDSRGKIIPGTRSDKDKRGVFTAKVEVSGEKKNGFSSFYPEDWSPQEVVDSINTAYKDALSNPQNPRGKLWIGYDGDLEIDMYLNDNDKIVTAYPIFDGE